MRPYELILQNDTLKFLEGQRFVKKYRIFRQTVMPFALGWLLVSIVALMLQGPNRVSVTMLIFLAIGSAVCAFIMAQAKKKAKAIMTSIYGDLSVPAVQAYGEDFPIDSIFGSLNDASKPVYAIGVNSEKIYSGFYNADSGQFTLHGLVIDGEDDLKVLQDMKKAGSEQWVTAASAYLGVHSPSRFH